MRLFILLSVFSLCLFAHQLRENYLHVDYNATTHNLLLKLEIETRLFEDGSIDDNGNEIISFKELRHHQEKLFTYIQKHIVFYYKGDSLALQDANITFHRYQTQTYMQIKKSFADIELEKLKLNYTMFFEKEKNHKLLIHLPKKQDIVLDKAHQKYSFVTTQMTQWQRLVVFIKEGVFHILDGTDHLLFVLMLLIPSVVKYARLEGGIKRSLFSLVKIITTFSIAHSTTLFIAGMGWYTPNTMIVESGIAFSIFVVAVLNFFHKYSHVTYGIVFFFGLIHGFGFANVLEIAQVNDIFSFIVALFGFNLGVEIGQVGVIIVLLPFLFFIMQWRLYMRVLQLLTLVTMVISSYWFFERLGLM